MREEVLTTKATKRQLVLSAMLFPRNVVGRRAYLMRLMLAAAQEQMDAESCFELTRDDIQVLLDAPSRKELKTEAQSATRAGVTAGELLASLVEMHASPEIEEPSMNKAVYFLTKVGPGRLYADGKPRRYSEATIRKHWIQVLPAVHFWGAHCFGKYRPVTTQDPLKSDDASEDLEAFLQHARSLRRFCVGADGPISRSGEPLVPSDAEWIDVAPESDKAYTLRPLEPPDRMLAVLKGYKAPPSG